jgi:hypothetical protein
MSIIRSSQIVTNGLVLALDAGDTNSYPSSGTSWNDLSGNGANFTLGCAGASCTNPVFSNNAFKTSFTANIDNFASFNNATTAIKNLLYSDHTIEIACKINSFTTGYDLNPLYTYETANALIIWQGYHSGLYLNSSGYLAYVIWNSTAGTVGLYPPQILTLGANIVIHAVRISNTLYIYINGALVASSAIAAPTNYGYNNVVIGATTTTAVVSQNAFVWASNIDFYTTKLYTIGFTQSQVTQNFNAMRGRLAI